MTVTALREPPCQLFSVWEILVATLPLLGFVVVIVGDLNVDHRAASRYRHVIMRMWIESAMVVTSCCSDPSLFVTVDIF